jgi:radical SAM superfamily enzyme YgiQ (UPF0313 family)
LNLLIACYELGHQPLSLAWPLAFLKQAGIEAETLDLAIQPLEEALVKRADFVGLSVPMHTALRIGVQAAQRIRTINPKAHICFFGLYAWLNEDYLLKGVADSVIAGEYEEQLVALIRAHGHPAQAEVAPEPTLHASPVLERLPFPLPNRLSLQPLDQYARYAPVGAEMQLAGYVEASRGCLHVCNHCPIVPVYGGRFFIVPVEVVIADVRQQVAAGAQHITFGDPDFLNGPKHALAVTRALYQEFPEVTFDFTAKVEHILKQRHLFKEFAALGCTFVVSAIESTSETVLEKLGKGHTAADIDTALAILDAAGIALQPTLVAFTPWTTLDDYVVQIEWITERNLVEYIPAIHLSIRLLIPPRSAILNLPEAKPWLGELDAANFTYRWAHPDPRMDALQAKIAEIVEVAAQLEEPARETYAKIQKAAYATAGKAVPTTLSQMAPRPTPPRLTENWFCCAEPTQAQIQIQTTFVADSAFQIL